MAIFTNQATLSYNNTTVNSNIVTGEIVQVLTATKTALSDNYSVGDTATYVVTLVNSGTAPFTGLRIQDNLGAYTFGAQTLTPLTYVPDSVRYFVNGVPQADPAETAAPLEFSGISVPAGGNATIVYEARVNDFAPLGTGGTITNTITVAEADGTPIADLTASAIVTNDEAAALSITKAISPETVPENGQLTYTFTIYNTGATPATATDNVTITDTFNPILDNITVALNGTTITEPTQYTYNEATGLFTTVPGVITVPAATYTQNPTTGQWNITPGTATLTVTGNL